MFTPRCFNLHLPVRGRGAPSLDGVQVCASVRMCVRKCACACVCVSGCALEANNARACPTDGPAAVVRNRGHVRQINVANLQLRPLRPAADVVPHNKLWVPIAETGVWAVLGSRVILHPLLLCVLHRNLKPATAAGVAEPHARGIASRDQTQRPLAVVDRHHACVCNPQSVPKLIAAQNALLGLVPVVLYRKRARWGEEGLDCDFCELCELGVG